MNVTEQLFALQDPGYRAFQSKLIPNVDPQSVIGVRVPVLRKLAKSLTKEEADAFLRSLPHTCYEENCLHGFLLEQIGDYSACVQALNVFLPYVDNWAVCDMTSPKALGKNRTALLSQIRIWMDSKHTYTIRFGILSLMRHFLGEDFSPMYLEWVAELRSDEYYVNMMAAWFFAEALVKQYDAALPFLQEQKLACWVHNKTIQKARESFRISPEQKAYLNTLKRLHLEHEL